MIRAYKNIKSTADIMKFFELKEHHYYQVWIQRSTSNPRYQCLLITGYDTGGYMYLISQGDQLNVYDMYSISLIKCLGPITLDTKAAHES